MEYIINTIHSIFYRLYISNIPNIELKLIILIKFSHIILFFLITRENSNFLVRIVSGL